MPGTVKPMSGSMQLGGARKSRKHRKSHKRKNHRQRKTQRRQH